uniref:F-box associated domain-containing protein n=1 Tax=Romanomermis culicivorax TaxID=13658 RepID=A0A915JZD0_ROMCU
MFLASTSLFEIIRFMLCMFKRKLFTVFGGVCASFVEVRDAATYQKKNQHCSMIKILGSLESTLSVLALKNDHYRDSDHLLLCDSLERKFFILNPLTGSSVIDGFRYRKEYLNENFPRLLCQLSATKFLFLECQCFGSSLDDLRMCEHSLIMRDLRDRSIIGRLNLSVVDQCEIWANAGGQILMRTLTPDGVRRCRIFDLFFRVESSELCSKELFFEEDSDLSFGCRKCACLKIGSDCFLIYFLTINEKQAFVGEVALWKVDFEERNPPFRRILLAPDSNSKMPPENLHNFQGPYLFDQDLFFLNYERENEKMIFFVLNFDGERFSWKSWTKETCISNFHPRNGVFVKNDHHELYWVQEEMISKHRIYKLGIDGRPSTLKRYAEKMLELSQNSFSSPLFSLNADDWLYDPKIYTVTICKLQAKFFDKFCWNILKMADTTFECEIKLSKIPTKFEITFKDEWSMNNFLNECRREMEENLNPGANWIVEIYDNLCYYNNSAPIFISMPYDFVFL